MTRPALSASDLRFLRSVCALMAERVPPEAMDTVRVCDVLARQELLDLRAAAMTRPRPCLTGLPADTMTGQHK